MLDYTHPPSWSQIGRCSKTAKSPPTPVNPLYKQCPMKGSRVHPIFIQVKRPACSQMTHFHSDMLHVNDVMQGTPLCPRTFLEIEELQLQPTLLTAADAFLILCSTRYWSLHTAYFK